MSKDSVSDWSTNASDNTDIGGISTQGTQVVSKLDDIVREIMGQIATARDDGSFVPADGTVATVGVAIAMAIVFG